MKASKRQRAIAKREKRRPARERQKKEARRAEWKARHPQEPAEFEAFMERLKIVRTGMIQDGCSNTWRENIKMYLSRNTNPPAQ